MQLALEQKITLGFATAFALLAASASAAWVSARNTAAQVAQVEHTHQMLDQLDAALIDLLNMQTATRGYLLSGRDRFLDPYRQGLDRLDDNLDRLGVLTSSDPAQRERVRELANAIVSVKTIMSERIDRYREQGFTAATQFDDLLEGKVAMDRVRAHVDRMRHTERALLDRRSAAARRGADLIFYFTLTGGGIAVAIIGFAAFRIRRDLRSRLAAEAERDRFFNLSVDLLCIASANGHFKRLSPAFTQTLGWSEAELLHRPFLDFVHPDDHAATLREVERQVRDGQPVLQFENRYRHRDGSWRVLSWRSTPHGGLMFATARDVTAQNEAAEALRRASAEIHDLYNRAPCGYHSLDEHGVFEEVNDTELEWLGYTREELVGRQTMRDLLAPSSQEVFARNFPVFLATGRVDNLEFELVRRDGSTFFVSLSATAVRDETGRFVRSRSTLHDISSRRAAEQELVRLNTVLLENGARLEAVNAELEAFSYSVSHDLRAPLRHMAGFAMLLEKQAGPQLDDKGRHYLATIQKAAANMGQLIDDLLSFSRVGRTPLQSAAVDHAALVDETIRQLNSAAARADWRIGPLPVLPGDPALLRQVWFNFLDNAVKYSAKSAAPRIEIAADLRAGEAIFSVRDNGAGFDPRYSAKLFQVFSRLHGAGEFEGTGIGLALVRRIVARHGGRTWAEGAPGHGACFFFALPMPPTPSPDASVTAL